MDLTKCFVLLCCLCLGFPISGSSIYTSGEVDDPDPRNDINTETERANVFRNRECTYEDPSSTQWKVYTEDDKYIIPYMIEDTTGVDHSQQLLEAFEDYHNFTCIRFRPRSDEKRYIIVTLINDNTEGNYDMDYKCGRIFQENKVTINVDCENMIYTLRRELYHLLGFISEHQRPDAGDYLNLNDLQGNDANRRKIHSVDLMPFDYYSISLDSKLRSKETNNPLGKGYGRLSYFDIKNINKVYKCQDTLLLNGCSSATLPRVIGAGHLNSNRNIYEQREGVRVLCDEGYEPAETQISYCENGSFSPEQLECRKIAACEDNIIFGCSRLDPRVCSTWYKRHCLRRCGLCESLCYSTPPIKTVGYISFPIYHKKFYFPNDQVEYKCPEGYAPLTKDLATCRGGSGWDMDEFQCVKMKSTDTSVHDSNPERESNKCTRGELPSIAHGRYEPNKKIYDGEDVVQLVCDHGYEPVSSSTAYCKKFNGDGFQYESFDYTHLECVKRKCENALHMDILYEMQGEVWQCDRAEYIGYMRKYSKKSCQLCDSCKSTPIFDRHASYLTPMKMEHQSGETVQLTCIKGYHPVNTATSECRGGAFNPPQLLCEPDSTSCVDGPPFIPGARSFFPVLEVYPSGYELVVDCLSSDPHNPSESQHIVRCVNGRFERYVCP